MREQYGKLGRYLRVVNDVSPRSKVDLVTVVHKVGDKPVFRRLFTYFEGVMVGWKEGCRRVISIDACFLKIFLGGAVNVCYWARWK